MYGCFHDRSVSKNLKIVDEISKHLDLNNKPHHLLCKSHTVEKLDISNLKVLSKAETNVKQRNTLENICPRLKSFFQGKKDNIWGWNRFFFDTGFTGKIR